MFNVRNSNLVLEFDDTTPQTVYFQSVLPRNYAGGGLTITLVWAAKTAVAGNVVWGASIERHQDGTDTIASDSFAAEQTVVSAAPGTAGIVKYATIAFTNGAQMDSLAAGENFRLDIRRVASDGSDTTTGNAQLIILEIKES